MADFFSQPSDLELLQEFLRPRVDTGKSPDVYSAHPEDLTSGYTPVTSRDGVTRWYFFTTLREKTGREPRTRRLVASGGSWHGEHKEKPVLGGMNGARAGYQKTFTFGRKEGVKLIRLGWLMSEVGFRDGGGGGQGRARVVLCKVYRSPRSVAASAPEASRAAQGSRGPNKIAGDAPPRASPRGCPRAAEGPQGASESALAGSPRTAEGHRGGSESDVAVGSATAVERSRGATESDAVVKAASAGCSCGHSAATATKAPRKQLLVAQIEMDEQEDASPDDVVMHRICWVKILGAPNDSASSRKRNERELSSRWLVLDTASEAAVPNTANAVCDSSSCARGGERLSS